jgi:predicted permease
MIIDSLMQDLRQAVRLLRQSPGFALLAIVSLALAIGADTALFSVVNGVLLNPLPYPQSGRLVTIYEKNAGLDKAPISYLNFLDWQRETRTFASMALYRHEDYTFTGRAECERVNGFMISASFFSTLGIRPILGRDFRMDDDRLGAAPVVLLGGGFWKRRFGSSPDVLGRSIELNGVAYTVVGIVPADFSFYGVQRDLYTPVGQWTDPSFRDRRVDESAHAVGRLLPGVTLAQAQDDMNAIARDLAATYPVADKNVGITLVSMKQDIVGSVQEILVVLLTAVGFLLLIACANVAGLLLARAMKRSHEFAVRAALGASRSRIIRQLLAESLLLSGLGGALGLLLAFFGTRAVISLFPAALPRAGEVGLDAHVLLFTLCVSLLAGVIFGLAPGFRGARISLQQVLREAGRGASRSRHRLQGLFVAAEVALALVLLVGAGLTIRSLAALWRVNPGYTPDHAITFTMSIPSTPKTTSADTRARLRRFDDAMRSVPGVEAVSLTLGSRPMIHDSSLPFWIVGQPKPANDNDMPQALFYLAEAGFQKAMGITLERGRFISPQDREGTPIVVDIDDYFAQTYFPHQNPVGRHIHLALFDQDAEIVGIVGHVRQWGPGNDPKSAIEAQFYYPYMQTPEKLMPLLADVSAVVLRTEGDPATVMEPVRRAVAGVDPGAVIYSVETLHEVMADTLAPRRLTMMLLGIFAALALTLSCVGLYGVISYFVGERTREIGVRMALGARRGDVLRLVLSQGSKMAFAGVAAGTLLAFALTRLIRSQLFGVSAHDPLTFSAVAALLVLVALAACYIPARRASRIEPVIALRCE